MVVKAELRRLLAKKRAGGKDDLDEAIIKSLTNALFRAEAGPEAEPAVYNPGVMRLANELLVARRIAAAERQAGSLSYRAEGRDHMIYLSLTPRDPIIARDGRPFGANQGRHMKSLNWLYPSVVAGSLRTLLGKITGAGFEPQTVADLKAMNVAGPLPAVNKKLFFPAPGDIAFREVEGMEWSGGKPLEFFLRRPFDYGAGEGCNFPERLLPLGFSTSPDEDFKPHKGPAFWSAKKMEQWLRDSNGKGFEPPWAPAGSGSEGKRQEPGSSGFLEFPSKDRRSHVKIDPDCLASEEGMLFSTSGLAMTEGVTMAVRVTDAPAFSEKLEGISALHPLGGERRLVHWAAAPRMKSAWDCPDSLKQALAGVNGVRMILASPAIFKHGWKPGWIDSDLTGTPPGTSVRLRLVAAAVDRWAPISGWGLESGKVGPKPVRRLAASGAVYFFKIESGNPSELIEKLWLRSVCDEEQDRNDGFGLALWGVWDADIKKGD